MAGDSPGLRHFFGVDRMPTIVGVQGTQWRFAETAEVTPTKDGRF